MPIAKQKNWVRNTLICSSLFFCLGLLYGFFSVQLNLNINDLTPESSSSSMAAIAQNNLIFGASLLVLGIVSFCVIPMILLFLNGSLTGAVVFAVFSGGHHETLVTGLLPHILFEVYGFFLITSSSIIPIELALLSVSHKYLSKDYIKTSSLYFMRLILSGIFFIIVGAFIEGNFSYVKF